MILEAIINFSLRQKAVALIFGRILIRHTFFFRKFFSKAERIIKMVNL